MTDKKNNGITLDLVGRVETHEGQQITLICSILQSRRCVVLPCSSRMKATPRPCNKQPAATKKDVPQQPLLSSRAAGQTSLFNHTSSSNTMTLSINNLGRYNPKKKSKCPRRRASIDGAGPTAASFQPLARMPRRMSCPNLKKNVSFSQHSQVLRVDRQSHDDLSALEKWYSEEDQLRLVYDYSVK